MRAAGRSYWKSKGTGDISAGNGRMIAVSVQHEDFDPGREQAALEASGGGAVASFTGLVRGDDGLVELHLDHYPDMTQARLEELGRERSEEHTSELQSLMRNSYAVFCLNK